MYTDVSLLPHLHVTLHSRLSSPGQAKEGFLKTLPLNKLDVDAHVLYSGDFSVSLKIKGLSKQEATGIN